MRYFRRKKWCTSSLSDIIRPMDIVEDLKLDDIINTNQECAIDEVAEQDATDGVYRRMFLVPDDGIQGVTDFPSWNDYYTLTHDEEVFTGIFYNWIQDKMIFEKGWVAWNQGDAQASVKRNRNHLAESAINSCPPLPTPSPATLLSVVPTIVYLSQILIHLAVIPLVG
jgi:hypothetical protein